MNFAPPTHGGKIGTILDIQQRELVSPMMQKFNKAKPQRRSTMVSGLRRESTMSLNKLRDVGKKIGAEAEKIPDAQYQKMLHQASQEAVDTLISPKISSARTLGEKKNKMVFGRYPAKPVEVVLQPEHCPKEMMKGMEDFFFKQPKMNEEGESLKTHPFLPEEYFYNQTQAMHFGDEKKPPKQ